MTHRLARLTVVTVVAVASLAGVARADAPDPASFGAPGSAFHDTGVLLGRALGDRSRGASVSTVTSGDGAGARTLAATYPPPQSNQAEELFATLLANFGKVEQMLGAPSGDIGAAAAMFVIAAYEGARNTSVDPSAYKPVADQLRSAIATSAAFAQATPIGRRTAYEQLAILGMFMGVTRAGLVQKPDAAVQERLRDSARHYLSQLSLDPDTMQIDRNGVSQPRAAAPAPAPAAPAVTKPTSKSKEFAYRTEPGKGIPASQIEAVVYSWHYVYIGMNPSMSEHSYLLLKSGVVRELPPVPPSDFDAAAEQRAEPNNWGTWRKEGNDYAVKWARDRGYSKLERQQIKQPGRSNETLNATYSASSSVTLSGAASWSSRSITFGADHRFSRSHSGGSGATGGHGDGRVVTSTSYDDHGSSSSASGPNVAAGSSRRANSADADRQGTYRIDGYTLELRYDSGRVERHFFMTNAKRDSIWFQGEDLMIPRH